MLRAPTLQQSSQTAVRSDMMWTVTRFNEIPERPEGETATRMESAAQQAEAEQLLPELFARIEEFERHEETGYFEVEAGSTLAVDDLYLYPLKISGPARASIASAIDQLRTVRLVVEGGDMPWIALFSLLRSAIETAASGIWLLESDERDVRMRRLLHLEWNDIDDAEKMMGNFGGSLDPPRETREEWVRRPLTGRSSVGTLAEVAARITSTDKVRLAQRVVWETIARDGRPEGLILGLWQGFSGLIHGRPYPMRVILDREEIGYDPSTGSVQLILTTGARSLLATLRVVLDIVDVSVRLYGRRSVQWQALPQDTADFAAARRAPQGTQTPEP